MTILLAAVSFLACAQNDKTQANAYDDAWETGWVTHCRAVYTASAKNASASAMVIHVGDSISHSNPYTQWPRGANVVATEDQNIIAWFGGDQGFPSGVNATSTNGLYLTAVDIGSRSMTSASGLSTDEILTGMNQTGPNMPGASDQATGRTNVTNGTITANLHIDSVAWAFSNANFAVLMLGTNDIAAPMPTNTFIANLGTIVDRLEARGIVVLVSTIPPRVGSDVTGYNSAIRNMAQTRGLPLIDYYAEILARQPINWNGTLIDSADGIHPTSSYTSGTTFNSDSNPYGGAGGNAGTFTTGANASNIGYLLRSWLMVQKLKEVKSYVVDGVSPPAPGPGPAPAPAPAPVPVASASGSGGGGGHKCGCNTIALASGPLLALLAAAAVALVLIRRR
jgi:hypothetical protein